MAFRNHQILEYEIPKYEGDLGSPNLYVRLSEEISHRKIDALIESFPSQHEKPWFTRDTFARAVTEVLNARGAAKFAEAFYCRKIAV